MKAMGYIMGMSNSTYNFGRWINLGIVATRESHKLVIFNFGFKAEIQRYKKSN